jgi:hypothetical protein
MPRPVKPRVQTKIESVELFERPVGTMSLLLFLALSRS